MEASLASLPPGPRLPRAVQTAGFIFTPIRWIEANRRRYGDMVTFSTAFDQRFVMVFDPALLKQVFQGSPEQLRAGDISVPTPATPATVKFRNITAVTPPCRPPLGSELHWRLLSHLALNNRSLASADSLRALLSLYNLQKLTDQQAGLANQLRVEAVQRVAGDRAFRVVEGSTVLGTSLTVDVAESGFAFLKGDAYLFGAVLEALLGEHVTLNAFSELTLRLQPSRTEYRWRPRSGRQQLL